MALSVRQKLEIIKGCLGISQTELAHRLYVSHVAFSRWWTGKAVPHPRKRASIDILLSKVTGCLEDFFDHDVSTKPKK